MTYRERKRRQARLRSGIPAKQCGGEKGKGNPVVVVVDYDHYPHYYHYYY